jgi:hypothetical protein
MTLAKLRTVIYCYADGIPRLEAYAWPGGYPIVYIDDYGSNLCPDCATKLLFSDDEKMQPCYWYIHHEGDAIQCDECNCMVESAYGGCNSSDEE